MKEIIESDEFTSIPEAKLVEILASDDLVVDKEETIFMAALKWLKVRMKCKERIFFSVGGAKLCPNNMMGEKIIG